MRLLNMFHHLIGSAVLECPILIGFAFLAKAERALGWPADQGKVICRVLFRIRCEAFWRVHQFLWFESRPWSTSALAFLSAAQRCPGFDGLDASNVLLTICQVGHRFAGQSDHDISLRDIVFERSRQFGVFGRRWDSGVSKLSFERICIGVSKMSLSGFVDHPTSAIRFFTMQGSIDIFLLLYSWILPWSMFHGPILGPDFGGESLALAAKANHSLAISKLLRKLVGQSGRGARVNS